MRPSSVGGGRILRRTLSVCLSVCPSVCPSVPFAEVVLLLCTLQPSYERTSKIEKLRFSIIGQRQPCGRVVSFVLFTFQGRIQYGDFSRTSLLYFCNVQNNSESEQLQCLIKQEAQLMLTTGSMRLAVSRGQQTWYHSTCYI